MLKLLDYIIRNLVSNKDAIEITSEETEDCVILKVRVDDGDIGAVIGKNGKVIHSIRAIIRAASTNLTSKYIVKVESKD